MIIAEHIYKSYGNLNVLLDVSIVLKPGEIVGLLGINGAGKSTLMKILAGVIQADNGKFIFNGADFTKNSLSIKREIGYLSEDNPLYEDMYVKEYLEYIAKIYKVDKQVISSVINTVDLKNECHKKIKELSKGNRQKVGIAQVLIHDPYFLILDESTNGLDPLQRESFYKLLIEISKEKIILFSTHNLQEIKDICTRFIILDKSQVVVDSDSQAINLVENTFYEIINENNR